MICVKLNKWLTFLQWLIPSKYFGREGINKQTCCHGGFAPHPLTATQPRDYRSTIRHLKIFRPALCLSSQSFHRNALSSSHPSAYSRSLHSTKRHLQGSKCSWKGLRWPLYWHLQWRKWFHKFVPNPTLGRTRATMWNSASFKFWNGTLLLLRGMRCQTFYL